MSRDALIVGINTYKHFNPLTSPAKDGEAIAQCLESYGHFTKVQRLPMIAVEGEVQMGRKTSVTRQQLRTAISELFNPKTENQVPDTALLYFSGHGWHSAVDASDHYLATSDANPAEDFGVDFAWLRSQLDRSRVRQQIIWLDCCNSGGLLNFDEVLTGKQGHARDLYFIASSRDFEVSYQDPASLYSLFTRALLEGLDPTRCDAGEVTSSTLTVHLEKALKPKIQGFRCHSTGGAIRLTYTTAKRQPTTPEPKPAQKLGTPLQMPPLPDHFVERPDHQQAVKDRLLSDDPKVFGTLVVSAIHGLGGIGKSVLAAKLAHDEQVQARFGDGILWATLGQNPDILPLLSGWIQALGDMDYKPTAIAAASAHLRTLLYAKRVLLVVDDIWDPDHLEPFRVGGSGCCVLVTTREARIPEAHCYALAVMSPEQALELMTQKLSEPLNEAEKAQALTFAQRVGYLPLALELAASQVEEGVSWADLLGDFQAELVRLESLDLYAPTEMPDDAKRRKYSLMACFNLSLKQLAPEQLRQFAWLGVVPEDVNLTQQMAATLWQVTVRQAGSILRQFSSKTLLLAGAKQQGNQRAYRLHDLMHDLAQRLLSTPPQPTHAGDLPGLGLTRAEAHQQLLERYRAQTQRGQWHTLPDDGYIYAYLTWHMEQAKQPEAVHRLLQASNAAGRNGWYDACDAIGKPAGFVNDLARGWRLAVAHYDQAPEATLAHLFRYALMRGSINSLASNVPAELVGALVKHQIWQPAQGLAYAQQAQNPWQRAECISALVPYLPEVLLPEVLTTIGHIHDAAYRSFVLAKLAERFPAYWPQVLDTVSQIQDRHGNARTRTQGFSCRAMALSQLISILPSQSLSQALDIARQIQDKNDRALALTEMARRIPKLWGEALDTVREIHEEIHRALALGKLVEHLPSNLFGEALEIAALIQEELHKCLALHYLAQEAPSDLSEMILEPARNIQDEFYRAIISCALLEKHSNLAEEIIEVIRQIQDEHSRALALGTLISQVPTEFLSKTLQMVYEIKDDVNRFFAFSFLKTKLPADLLKEVIEETRSINELNRVTVLMNLANQNPELSEEILKVAQPISGIEISKRAEICRKISQQHPKLLGEALEATRKSQGEYNRAKGLMELAQKFPGLWELTGNQDRTFMDSFGPVSTSSKSSEIIQSSALAGVASPCAFQRLQPSPKFDLVNGRKIAALRTQQVGGKKTAILSRNPKNGLVDVSNGIGGRRNAEDTADSGQVFNASFGKG
jgi:uncharacterized membrane protein YkvA (DUF1232 family)